MAAGSREISLKRRAIVPGVKAKARTKGRRQQGQQGLVCEPSSLSLLGWGSKGED